MNPSPLKLAMKEINALSREDFTRGVGPVFEHSPWIASETWDRRPFHSVENLHEACCNTVRAAAQARQLDLIRAHPDLVGRAALAGGLTPASTSEQSTAGLLRLTASEIATFQQFNQQYRDKFGFPFVICARLNKKDAILAAFPERLKHSVGDEIRAALEEIYKIAYLRLRDIVSE